MHASMPSELFARSIRSVYKRLGRSRWVSVVSIKDAGLLGLMLRPQSVYNRELQRAVEIGRLSRSWHVFVQRTVRGVERRIDTHLRKQGIHQMTESSYTPPKVWKWDTESGGTLPISIAPLPVQRMKKRCPLASTRSSSIHSQRPTASKSPSCLEELLALGIAGAEYDAHLIDIREGDQFGSGFVGR